MKDNDKRQIRKILKSWKRTSRKFKQAMGELGLTVTMTGGSHMKIENKSNGKFVYLANSPSDCRAAMNEEGRIRKMLE
jgi:hypothetical protein